MRGPGEQPAVVAVVGAGVLVAGMWNALWHGLRHLDAFWGLATLISGLLMMGVAIIALAEHLKTRLDAALLRIHITSYDGRDTPIMHNDFFARGDRFRYQLNAGV